MFSLQSHNRLEYLVSATKHVPPALFSNLGGNRTEKAIATTVLKYPKTDFGIGKPYLPKGYEDSTLQGFINNELWIFFDLLVIEI